MKFGLIIGGFIAVAMLGAVPASAAPIITEAFYEFETLSEADLLQDWTLNGGGAVWALT